MSYFFAFLPSLALLLLTIAPVQIFALLTENGLFCASFASLWHRRKASSSVPLISGSTLFSRLIKGYFLTTPDQESFHVKKAQRNDSLCQTDGHRLSSITNKINTPVEEEKMIIPRKAAAEIRRFLDRDTENLTVVIGKNHVMFKIEEVEF